MTITELLAAVFFLQPSLIIIFAPVQIIALFLFLLASKKNSIFRTFFYAFSATLFAVLTIFLMGIMSVPFLHVHMFQLLSISFGLCFILIFISSCLYWFLIYFYLVYLVKMPDITMLGGLSSAIAGLSVLTLYCLL
jgi:hypothetical protein